MERGGLNWYAMKSVGCFRSFSSRCLGRIQQAFQRTVKLRWKRLLGEVRLKTTVYLSGVSTLATCFLKDAPEMALGFWVRISTVYLTSAEVNSTPSLQRMPFLSFAVIWVKSLL